MCARAKLLGRAFSCLSLVKEGVAKPKMVEAVGMAVQVVSGLGLIGGSIPRPVMGTTRDYCR